MLDLNFGFLQPSLQANVPSLSTFCSYMPLHGLNTNSIKIIVLLFQCLMVKEISGFGICMHLDLSNA